MLRHLARITNSSLRTDRVTITDNHVLTHWIEWLLSNQGLLFNHWPDHTPIAPTLDRSETQTVNQPEFTPAQPSNTSSIINRTYAEVIPAPIIQQGSSPCVRQQGNTTFYVSPPAVQQPSHPTLPMNPIANNSLLYSQQPSLFSGNVSSFVPPNISQFGPPVIPQNFQRAFTTYHYP